MAEIDEKYDYEEVRMDVMRIRLFPCGLPDIDGCTLYSCEEKDSVMRMCAKMGSYGVCTLEMAGECVDMIFRKNRGATELMRDGI